MNSPKFSSEWKEVPQITLFRAKNNNSIISLSPVKIPESFLFSLSKNLQFLPPELSIYEQEQDFPSKKSSFSKPNDMQEGRSRSPSIKKGMGSRTSILLFQAKRTSSISMSPMSPRKPSALYEMDESKVKKKNLDVLDVYTEEQLITVFSKKFAFLLTAYIFIFRPR